jgi:hypothetical protein
MYKYRFKQWGLRKNIRADEVQHIQRRAADGDKVQLPSVCGREVGSKQLKTSIKRYSDCRARIQDLLLLPPSIASPDILRIPEAMLHAAASHSNVQRDSAIWEAVGFDPIYSASCTWYHDMLLAVLRLRTKTDANTGFRLIEKCCAQYGVVLKAKDPFLLWFTYCAILELSQVTREIGLSFANYVADLCAIQMGHAHPLTILLLGVVRAGVGSMHSRHAMSMVIEAQFNILSANTKAWDKFWLLYVRLMLRRLAGTELSTTENALAKPQTMVLREFKSSGLDAKRPIEVGHWTQIYVAMVHVTRGEYIQSETVLRGLVSDTERTLVLHDRIPASEAQLRTHVEAMLRDYTSSEMFYRCALASIIASEKKQREPESQRQINISLAYATLESTDTPTANLKTAEAPRNEYIAYMESTNKPL